MDNKCVEKLLETVAFSNGCICSVELIRWEHTHFHPSGKLQPSEDDTRLTDRMVNLCQHMGIPLLDHVIVGGSNQEYFSFCQKKILPTAHITYESNYEMINFPISMAAERGRSR